MIARQIFKSFSKKANNYLNISSNRRALINFSSYAFTPTRQVTFMQRYQFSGISQEIKDKIRKDSQLYFQLPENNEYEKCLKVFKELVPLKEKHGLSVNVELYYLGSIYLLLENKKEGLMFYNKTIEILKREIKASQEVNVNTNLMLSDISLKLCAREMELSNHIQALQMISEGISLLENSAKIQNPQISYALIENYCSRAQMYYLQRKLDEYEDDTNKAQIIFENFGQLSKDQKRAYALMLEFLANVQINRVKIKQAETNVTKAKQLWKEIEKEPHHIKHFTTLLLFSSIQHLLGRDIMIELIEIRLKLREKLKQDQSYQSCHILMIFLLASILKSKPQEKATLQILKKEFEEALRIIKELSKNDKSMEMQYQRFKSDGEQMFK